MTYEVGSRWRHLAVAIVGALLTLVLLSTARFSPPIGHYSEPTRTVIRVGAGLLAAVLGVLSIHEALVAAFAGVQKRQGVVTWRNLLAWSFYALLLIAFAEALNVNLNTLLFGGAVATIVLATLAQNSLSNVFAGVVLMLARPYRVGQLIYLRSGQFGGAEYEGVVVDIGGFYTVLSSRGELIKIPNTSVIASVLMTRFRPKRAEMELDLSPEASIPEIESAVRRRLSLSPGSRIRIEPLAYRRTGEAAWLTFRLQVFAEHPIDQLELVKAIDDAAGRREAPVRAPALR